MQYEAFCIWMVEENTASFLEDSDKETLIVSMQEENTQAQLGTIPLWQRGLIKEWTVLCAWREWEQKVYKEGHSGPIGALRE